MAKTRSETGKITKKKNRRSIVNISGEKLKKTCKLIIKKMSDGEIENLTQGVHKNIILNQSINKNDADSAKDENNRVLILNSVGKKHNKIKPNIKIKRLRQALFNQEKELDALQEQFSGLNRQLS